MTTPQATMATTVSGKQAKLYSESGCAYAEVGGYKLWIESTSEGFRARQDVKINGKPVRIECKFSGSDLAAVADFFRLHDAAVKATVEAEDAERIARQRLYQFIAGDGGLA